MLSFEDDLCVLKAITEGNLKDQKRQIAEQFPIALFPGRFPVRTLKNNVMTKYNAAFSSAKADLKYLTESGQLNSNLYYSYNDDKLSCPSITREHDGIYSISMSESFAAYSWCVAYYLILQYEFLIQDVRHIKNELSISDGMIERSKDLFDWAISLKYNALVSWPSCYPNPNPTSELVGSEPLYCLKCNNVFSNIVCFCLFHELGHSLHRDVKNGEKTVLEMEQSADNYALDCIFSNIEDCRQVETGLAALIGFGELLFIPDDVCGLIVYDHPVTLEKDSSKKQVLELLSACDECHY